MSLKRLLLGRKGEKEAEKYLKRKGFKLLNRNYKLKAGEIDLIMEDGEELVIVEVRTVQKMGQYTIDDKIPPSKREQVKRVTKVLESLYVGSPPPIRFDVVLVTTEPDIYIEHIQNAF